jgi:hypothetical protein
MKFKYQFVHSKKQELLLFFSESFLFIFHVIIYFLIVFRFQNNITKIFKKKNKIAILANGPSLKKDLAKLRSNYQLIVLNNFPAQKYFFKLQPKFVCWIDSMYSSNINELSDQVKFPILKTFENLNKVSWKIFLFVPQNIEKKIKSKLINKNITLIVIPKIYYDFESSIYLSYLSYFCVPPPNINVAITAIYISILSGVRKISLFGADMNFINSIQVDQKNNQCYSNYIHFYKSHKKRVKFTDKFKNRKPKSMYVNFKRQASAFKWFAYLAMTARKLNISLTNKSSYSLIDSINR